MLLADFKAVTELDNEIDFLHKKLGDLYQLRANYALETGKASSKPQTTKNKLKKWNKTANTAAARAEQQYRMLSDSWATYGIDIPVFKALKPRLLKAEIIMQELENSHPELAGNLNIILIPPAKLINQPGLRAKQHFIKAADYVDPELQFSNSSRWQVLVVYSAFEGLALGTLEAIIDTKAYMLAGHDTRALGILEYKALSLQMTECLDAYTWTLLLKNYRPSTSERVPSAACLNGQYRFEMDDSAGLLEEERYRPAVQVKA